MMRTKYQILFALVSAIVLFIGGSNIAVQRVAANELNLQQAPLQPDCALTNELLGGQGFDFAGQGFDFAGQGFDFAGQGFDFAGQGLNLSGQGFDFAGQGFDFAGQNYADPAVVAQEILDNVAPENWVAELLNALGVPEGVGYGDTMAGVIIVDEGQHLDQVLATFNMLADETDRTNITVRTIDISDPAINFRVEGIRDAIFNTVNALRSEGYVNNYINISMAFVPCSDPVTGWNIDEFIEDVEESREEASTGTPSEINDAAITPVFECIYEASRHRRYARFGYDSDNTETIKIAVGHNNRFWPYPKFRTQPDLFQPGDQSGVFEVRLPRFGGVIWQLRGPDGISRLAYAPQNGVRCDDPLPHPTEPIIPILECVFDAGDGVLVARLGYDNQNDTTVYIPRGGKNKFVPYPRNRGQVTHFLPGRHANVFEVTLHHNNTKWRIKGPDRVRRTLHIPREEVPCATDSPVVSIGDYLAQIDVPTEDIPETILGYLNDTTDVSPLRDLFRDYLIESEANLTPYNTFAIASSGNYRPWAEVLGITEPNGPFAPARWPEVMDVSASLGLNPDQIWFFSQFGSIMARGAGYNLTSIADNLYVAGTSHAAPAVTLIVAHFGKFADACTFPVEDGVVYPPIRNLELVNQSVEGDPFPIFCDVPTNGAPVAVDDFYSVEQDSSLGVEGGVLVNDTDPEDDDLTATLVDDVDNGVLSLFEDGSFEYTPGEGFFGTDTFTYTAFDGLNTSNEATVTITVDQASFFVQPLILTSFCSDEPAESRRWRVRNPNSFDVDVRWVVVGTDQTDSFTAPPGDTFFFTETVEGSNTTKLFWFDETETEQETVKASSGDDCNPEPVVQNLQLTSLCTSDATVRRWRVRNPNAFDVDITWELYPNVETGEHTATPGDSFFFTTAIEGPNTTKIYWFDEEDVEQETVKASNNQLCGGGTATVVNTAPTAENISVTTWYFESVEITLKGNDVDLADTIVSYVIVDAPEYGSLIGDGQVLTYVPNEGFAGFDSFTYQVYDNHGAVSNVATVEITVNEGETY